MFANQMHNSHIINARKKRGGGGGGGGRAHIQHKLLFVELLTPTFVNAIFSEMINMLVWKIIHAITQSSVAMQKN